MASTTTIQIGLLIIMALGTIGVFSNRHFQSKGLGVRTAQFMGVVLAIPAVLLLAFEGIIGPQSTTALLGTILGFLLSGFGKE